MDDPDFLEWQAAQQSQEDPDFLEWQSVQDAPAPVQPPKPNPWYVGAASGVLSGISGLASAADYVTSPVLNPSRASQLYGELFSGQDDPNVMTGGEALRSAFDLSTGVQDSTAIDPDSFAYKAGEYLPAMLGGAPSLAGKGVLGGIKTGAGILGRDIAAAFGGKVGEEAGGVPGEIIGAAIGGNLPEIGKGIVKRGTKLLTNVPSEEEALLNAFKLTDKQSIGYKDLTDDLLNAKKQGIVAEPKTSIFGTVKNKPFAETEANLTKAITDAESEIQTILTGGKKLRTKDILPVISPDKIRSGVDSSAIASAVKTESDGLVKMSLQKAFPGKDGEKLFQTYSTMASRAAAGDAAAAKALGNFDRKINNVLWSPAEVRELRTRWDKLAKYDSSMGPGQKEAYKELRSGLQEKLLQTADKSRPQLEKAFEKQSGLLGLRGSPDKLGPIPKMAAQELKGKTQELATVPRVIGTPARFVLSKGLALLSDKQPVANTRLKQAFGKTLSQVLTNTDTTLKVAPVLASTLSGVRSSKDYQSWKRENKEGLKAVPEFAKATDTWAKAKKVSSEIKAQKKEAPEQTAALPEAPKQKQQAMNAIVNAMIQVESGMKGFPKGNPKAVSPKGAQGIMQIMPYMGKRYGLKNPFDPDENRKVGTKIFEDELDRFKDVLLAVAAYNAGSPAVNRAIKKAGSRDFDSIAKYLPEETQKYVEKVLGNINLG